MLETLTMEEEYRVPYHGKGKKAKRTNNETTTKTKKKKVEAAKTTYAMFVAMVLTFSALLLYQQAHFIRRKDALLVELPWMMEFTLAHHLSKRIPREFPPYKKPRMGALPDPTLQMCDACEKAIVYDDFHCKRRIIPWLKNNVTMEALRAGQESVANQFANCSACHPSTCQASMKVHLRFDEAAPTIHHAVTHEFPSIPERHRIPDQVLNIMKPYFQDWDDKKPDVLFTYSPSIVQIPPESEISVPGAAYLASYRISPWHQCGFATYNFRKRQLDLMGLALLDENLQMIPDSDHVFDLNKFSDVSNRETHLVNFRIFAVNNTFWLLENDVMAQLRIRTPAFGTRRNSVIYSLLSLVGLLGHEYREPRRKSVVTPIFGSGVVEMSLPTGVHQMRLKDGTHNVFMDDKEEPYVEVFPYKPRHTTHFSVKKVRTTNGLQASNVEVDESFLTGEYLLRRQHHFEKDRGGACCATLEREFFRDLTTNSTILQYPELRLGISSRRTIRQFQHDSGEQQFLYLNRLYAFVPTPPFDIVALSGSFCLGHSSKEETKDNQYARLTKQKNPLTIHKDTYDCPAVQIATGITDKAGDDERVVVSYGINDCVPRMVEFDKRELAHHLFSPLSDLEFLD